MIVQSRHHRRGSILLFVVGLLMLVGMVASAFMIFSRLDRKEAMSLATAAPMKQVASGVLQRILAERAADLYIDDKGTADPTDDVLYGKADTVAKTIDYPNQGVDPVLSVFGPTGAMVWSHLSNLPGDLQTFNVVITQDATTGEWKAMSVDPSNPANVKEYPAVDTDGWAYWRDPNTGVWQMVPAGPNTVAPDSILYPSGIRDRAGREYHVAVRVIDASALLNVNLAYSPDVVRVGKVMPVTDLSLLRLTGAAVRDAVHAARATLTGGAADSVHDYWTNYALRPLNIGPDGSPRPYAPFDASDLLALLWGANMPSTAMGRLYAALGGSGGVFPSVRPFLTTHSACRITAIPRVNPWMDLPGSVKVDLNRADAAKGPADSLANYDLFRAFFDLIPPGINGISSTQEQRLRTAAQLTVNALDFRDSDENVTVKDVPGVAGTKVYGIERQPFLVEIAYKIDLMADGSTEEYYALELFNPYVTPIDTRGWEVRVGGAAGVPLGINSIAAGGRLVIRNRAEVLLGSGASAATVQIDSLDLKQEVRILRPAQVGGSSDYVVVAKVEPADFATDPTHVAPQVGVPAMECARRDDRPADALYSVALYPKHTNDDITAAASNLGLPNGVTINDFSASASGQRPTPHPVYVRNGGFVNVAELNRIFYVGPSASEPVDYRLRDLDPYDTQAANGRLNMGRIVAADGANPSGENGPYNDKRAPALPLGCFAADLFMVHSPAADTVDNDGDGKIDAADNDGGEDIVYGWVNINTAPEAVLLCLPGLDGTSALPADVGTKIVQEIVEYRDKPAGGNYAANGRSGVTGISNLREDPGFASPAEIAIPIHRRATAPDIPAAYRLPQNTYLASNASPYNYRAVADGSDDGLSVAGGQAVTGDLTKHQVYYAWLSNHLTVRSDVYIAYIRVQIGTSTTAPEAMRRYIAVIDRSNCRSAGDMPNVVMFAEIK